MVPDDLINGKKIQKMSLFCPFDLLFEADFDQICKEFSWENFSSAYNFVCSYSIFFTESFLTVKISPIFYINFRD
jgi:hypothetical protein